LHGEHTRDSDPLLLSRAKVIGRLIERIHHAHLGESGTRTSRGLFGSEAQIQRSEGDVFQNAGHEKLIVRVLEDDSNLLPDLLQRLLFKRQATDFDLAAPVEQSVQMKDEGGFTGAIRA